MTDLTKTYTAGTCFYFCSPSYVECYIHSEGSKDLLPVLAARKRLSELLEEVDIIICAATAGGEPRVISSYVSLLFQLPGTLLVYRCISAPLFRAYSGKISNLVTVNFI